MGRPGAIIYFDFRPGLRLLPPEKRCAVYDAILDYAEHGEVPCFADPESKMLWEMIRPKLDADAQSYTQKVEKRRSAANSRWNAHESTSMQMDANAQDALEKKERRNSIIADKPPTRPRFSPPSVDSVRAYCMEHGFTVDAERFVDFYESNGWMVGKNKMKEWKAAVRTWAKRDSKLTAAPEEFPDGCPWTVV